MKLSKILKNRKAMTPLMIGIIVAASVVAVLMVVMAAVVPLMHHEVYMQIREGSVKAASNDSIALKFNVMCDYDEGELWRVEIFKDGQFYGYRNIANLVTPVTPFDKNEEKTITINYFLTQLTQAPPAEIDEGRLVFQDLDEYTIVIYFRPVDDTTSTLSSSLVFTFRKLSA
ncbi:MAG: hypothetical protein ACFFDW_06235 [Candidatus Thorarchaeota archaeon]